MRLLYFIPESWPTFRPDISILFGKYLPLHGITTDFVTDRTEPLTSLDAGLPLLHKAPQNRALYHPAKLIHTLRVLLQLKRGEYDAIQVRNMPVHAMFAFLAARILHTKFYYWMSFPQSEGQILRAKARGWKAGLRYWFPLVQGYIGKLVLYRVVMPAADHIFVQSSYMSEDLVKRGIPIERLTPVPMGVDTAAADPAAILPIEDRRLLEKRVVVYLGTLDRERCIDILIEMLALALPREPDLMLVLVGDTVHSEQRDTLKRLAEQRRVSESLIWTGWLPTDLAWRYVRAAEVGISPIPRGFLFDCSSPTKAVEYLALGVPVLANDNPDQTKILRESEAGVCVEFSADAFADALVSMLRHPEQLKRMGQRGRTYITTMRGYDRIAAEAANTYYRVQQRDSHPHLT